MNQIENKDVKVGMLGLGNVAGGVANRFAQSLLEHDIHLKTIAVRDPHKVRNDIHLGVSTRLTDDPLAVLCDPEIDIVVELTGAENEIAKDFIATALRGGKHVVTGHKQVLGEYLPYFNVLARANDVSLSYEASVCGTIPVMRTFEYLTRVQRVGRVEGIINGTTNSILTKMGEGMTFDSALREAMESGVAEPDPTDDIEGYDARAKLAILATLASGFHIRSANIPCQGIAKITLEDVTAAWEKGGVIKLLASARKEDGIWSAQVRPEFIPNGNPLAAVTGTFNSVTIEADLSGPITLYGKGAGRYPTAAAVLADILHASEHVRYKTPDYLPNFKESTVLLSSYAIAS